MHADRAMRPGAASAIDAASAHDSIGFGNLNGEQTEDQQAGRDDLHGLPLRVSSLMASLGHFE
jgi:hypothetical protein